jgi:ribosomal-protein-alanine N-acetyltransferase
LEPFVIRPAVSADIPRLIELDHSYNTDHVWQMALQPGTAGVEVAFREVRLPRPMHVLYPRRVERLADEWTDRSHVSVGEVDGRVAAYLALAPAPAPDALWVTDLAVEPAFRRQGLGIRLLGEAIGWGRANDQARLFLEMQSKNFPAIQLARKLGFVFSGYSDFFYPNEDISLFFSLDLVSRSGDG